MTGVEHYGRVQPRAAEPSRVHRARRERSTSTSGRPASRRPGVLVLQEIFGVGEYIEAVCERLPAAGYVVAAPDLYWRFAPGLRADHDEAGMQASFEQVGKLDVPQAAVDAVGALGRAGRPPRCRRPAGRARLLPRRHAGVGRRRPRRPELLRELLRLGRAGMLGLADQVRCPVLFHFGDDDPYIPAEGIEARRRGRRPATAT